MLEWIGFFVGVAGLIPTTQLAANYLRNRFPIRRVLGFNPKTGIEIIMTTSGAGLSSVGPADESQRAFRTVSPSGDLAAVGEISALLAKAYPRLDVAITPSARWQDNNRRDLVLVGGPAHNRYVSAIMSSSQANDTGATPLVFDANARYIRMEDKRWGPNLDLQFEDMYPQVEYGIVMLTHVHRYGRDQRVVIVAGMTTYGTHAAAHFLTHELVKYCRKQDLGRTPSVCILVKAELVNTEPYNIKPLHHVVLPDSTR